MTVPPGRTLAGAKTKLVLIPAGGIKNPAAPTITELNAGKDASCRLLKDGTHVGAAASETIDGMAALCEDSNAKTFGKANFEGKLVPFRWFKKDKPGQADPQGDEIFQMLKTKGTDIFVVVRVSAKPFDAPFEAEDEISVYQAVTDTPRYPEGENGSEGYIRAEVDLAVNNGWPFIAAKAA